ncbi:hypothetical protein EJB05_05918, partial [Eragrostis curvula]
MSMFQTNSHPDQELTSDLTWGLLLAYTAEYIYLAHPKNPEIHGQSHGMMRAHDSRATKGVTKGGWGKDGKLYEVETGRRDGRVSRASEAVKNLPDSFDGIRKLTKRFASKGLNLKDLAVLSGAHAIGTSHCPSIAKRLRNFTAHQDTDPTLDATYAAKLRRQCRRPKDNTTELEMVPRSSTSFDTEYYRLVVERKGLFHSDQALLRNDETKSLMFVYLRSQRRFLQDFAASMVKMGRVGVLTGNQGEIRRRCAVVN